MTPAPPHSIFAGDMWAVFTVGDPNARYQAFMRFGRPRFKRFIESLILEDTVVVPTEDFMSLAMLLGRFGEDQLLPLLESETLKIVRIKGALAYVGGGVGLATIEAQSASGPKKPFCAPIDEAVTWAIAGLKRPTSDTFVNTVINKSHEVALSVLGNDVIQETYKDVRNSPSLRDAYSVGKQDLKHLHGIKPDAVRIYGGPDIEDQQGHDEIGVLLRLAHANLELKAATELKCTDSSTSSPVGRLLKAKQERVAGLSEKPFAVLREIADLPDVGEAVLSGAVDLGTVMKLRNSKNGKDFRTWFQEHCSEDPIQVGREYARLLKEVHKVDSALGRTIRFGVTTAAGFFGGPPTGIAASAADSFFVSRLLRGHSAKFFIDDVTNLALGKSRP